LTVFYLIQSFSYFYNNTLIKFPNIFSIAIITVPPVVARSVALKSIDCGIKGILNFTTTSLNMPDNVYLEEYDMVTSLEKVAYFVKEA